jgi:hypothetical protein
MDGCGGTHLSFIPAEQKSTDRKIMIQAGLAVKVRPYLKSNQCEKGWRSGLSCRIPA